VGVREETNRWWREQCDRLRYDDKEEEAISRHSGSREEEDENARIGVNLDPLELGHCPIKRVPRIRHNLQQRFRLLLPLSERNELFEPGGNGRRRGRGVVWVETGGEEAVVLVELLTGAREES
jgi:hypothetical protein